MLFGHVSPTNHRIELHGVAPVLFSRRVGIPRGGNLSWAKGAIIWEVNHRFSSLQPLCASDSAAAARSEL